MKTKRDIVIERPAHRTRYMVPAGSSVEPIAGEPGWYWVKPSNFPAGSFARHDAEHYGFRVSHVDVEA